MGKNNILVLNNDHNLTFMEFNITKKIKKNRNAMLLRNPNRLRHTFLNTIKNRSSKKYDKE